MKILGIDYSNEAAERECRWNKYELKQCIIQQNELEDTEFEVVAIMPRKKSFSAIIEASNRTHKTLIAREKLKIGWGLCKVLDHIDLSRCFKCNGYNHKATNCKNKTSCGYCAEDHQLEECETDDDNLVCINCIKANEKWNMNLESNHSVFDPCCAVYKRKAEEARKQFDYADNSPQGK